MEGTHHACVAK